MKYLSLRIPGFGEVEAPDNVPSGIDAPSNIISLGLDILIVLGIIASLIFLIYGEILWITSQGDKQKLDKARKTIVYSILGLIIISLSFVILRIIGQLISSPYLTNFGNKP
jgi:hypothetical protein